MWAPRRANVSVASFSYLNTGGARSSNSLPGCLRQPTIQTGAVSRCQVLRGAGRTVRSATWHGLNTATGILSGTPALTGSYSCFIDVVITNDGMSWGSSGQFFAVIQ